jgi:hypothetical protein
VNSINALWTIGSHDFLEISGIYNKQAMELKNGVGYKNNLNYKLQQENTTKI